jgi:hypothetical protein
MTGGRCRNIAAAGAGALAVAASFSLENAAAAAGGGLYPGITRFELLLWLAHFALALPGLALLAWGLAPLWPRTEGRIRIGLFWGLALLAALWVAEARFLRWHWLDDRPATTEEGALAFGGKAWAQGSPAVPPFDPLFGFTMSGLERRGNLLWPKETPGALMVAAAAAKTGLGHLLFAMIAAAAGACLVAACGKIDGKPGQVAAALLWSCSPMVLLLGLSSSAELLGRTFLAFAYAAWLALQAGEAGRQKWPAIGLGIAAALAFATRPVEALCLLVPVAFHLGWRAWKGSTDHENVGKAGDRPDRHPGEGRGPVPSPDPDPEADGDWAPAFAGVTIGGRFRVQSAQPTAPFPEQRNPLPRPGNGELEGRSPSKNIGSPPSPSAEWGAGGRGPLFLAGGLAALGPLGLFLYARIAGDSFLSFFGDAGGAADLGLRLAYGSGSLALLLVVFFAGPVLLPLAALAFARGGAVVLVAAGGLLLLLLRPLLLYGDERQHVLGPEPGGAAALPLLLLAVVGLAELRRRLAAGGFAARPWAAAGLGWLAGLLLLASFQGRALAGRAELLERLELPLSGLQGAIVLVEPAKALWVKHPEVAMARRWAGELPHPDPFLRDPVIFADQGAADPNRLRRAFPRRELYLLRASAGPELYRLEKLP